MFNLSFSTDNAAFAEGDAAAETARRLRRVADAIEAGVTDGKIFDSNGNSIGDYVLYVEEESEEEET